MRASASVGCLGSLARGLLVVLLALTSAWSLWATFLVNLNARPVATAFATEAATEFLTPAVADNAFVTTGVAAVEAQAKAQPNGSVYFPFVRVPIPAQEVAGKGANDVLHVVYTHAAGAYYDQGSLDALFGLTAQQMQQDGPYLKQVCAQVATYGAQGKLPPGVDLNSILATLTGQGAPGSGSGGSTGTLDPAQAQAELHAMQQMCTALQRGNGLSLSDLTAILSATAATGNPGNSGVPASPIPTLPDLSGNPFVRLLGLSSVLSAKAESQAADLQHWGLGIAALETLLVVLLSRRWGRLAWAAIGVLFGGGSGLALVGTVSLLWSRNAGAFQPHASLLHTLGAQFTPPYAVATIVASVGILAAAAGTIAMKTMAAHAGVSAATGIGAGRNPALVGPRNRPPFGPGSPASRPPAQMSPTVQTTLPVEPFGVPPAAPPPAPAPRAQPDLPPSQPPPGPQPAYTDPDGPTFGGE